MQMLKNKTKISAITFVLVLTISAILVAFPSVGAHDPPWQLTSFVYIAVTNNPIGVGQEQVIVFWPHIYPPTAEGTYGDRYKWTVKITKPDGSEETLGPFTSDPVGGGWTRYTPDQVGTYSVVAIMDDCPLTGLPVNPYKPNEQQRGFAYWGDTILGGTSDPVEFTVQQEPIQPWAEPPLPTEYWERPINAMNRNWYVLAGNWLSGPAINVGPTIRFSYGEGPESSHIMWATPFWAGGIMDARFGSIGYQTGHYEGLYFNPPIILNGKLYYNVKSLPIEGWYCLDLYSGEVEYFHNTTGPVIGVSDSASGRIAGEALAFAQIYNYESPNQHGGMPYLWSVAGPEPNTWMMFDAFSGNYICSINNVPSWANPAGFGGAGVRHCYGKEGSILAYNIVNLAPSGDAPDYYLQCWNTSRAIWYKESYSSNAYWLWRPGLNVTYDGNNGYSLNVSMPSVSGSILAVREDLYVIGGTSGKHNATYVEEGQLWALSLEKGQEGTLLWNRTFTPPQTVVQDKVAALQSRGRMTGPIVDPEDGVFLFSESVTRKWWGFSLDTMQQLWESKPEPQMEYYEMPYIIYQGKLFSTGYSGVLTAYDIKTGDVLWNYTAPNVGFESPYGNYPLLMSCVADGKIYVVSGEHSPTQPLWRGSYLRCINASNGAELWKILHWGNVMGGFYQGVTVIVGDGYVVGLNLYDNKIYCYGKGPSATTVTASPKISDLGTTVLVEGMVTDQCAGAKQLVEKGKFSSVPAISDEDQSAWMEYLYQQQAKPKDAEGVEVVITTLDPNGNTYELGRTTTNTNGVFGCVVEPPVPGKYEIIATFEGSESYYGSCTSTYINVEEAPSPAQPIEPEAPAEEPAAPEEPTEEPTEPEPEAPTEPEEPTEPEPTEPIEAPFITTEIAILLAAVIVAIAVIFGFWILRKRK